jgi:hypothetical protein
MIGEYASAQRTLETYIDLARQRGFVAHLVAHRAAAQAQLALAHGNLALCTRAIKRSVFEPSSEQVAGDASQPAPERRPAD